MSDDPALHLTHEAEAETFYCPACGRIFGKLSAYNSHAGSCPKQKKRMASALELAQETYRRKKLRLNDPPIQPQLVLQPEYNLILAEGPSHEEVSSYLSGASACVKSLLIDIRPPLFLLQPNLRMQTVSLPSLLRNDALADKIAGPPCATGTNCRPLRLLCLPLF